MSSNHNDSDEDWPVVQPPNKPKPFHLMVVNDSDSDSDGAKKTRPNPFTPRPGTPRTPRTRLVSFGGEELAGEGSLTSPKYRDDQVDRFTVSAPGTAMGLEPLEASAGSPRVDDGLDAELAMLDATPVVDASAFSVANDELTLGSRPVQSARFSVRQPSRVVAERDVVRFGTPPGTGTPVPMRSGSSAARSLAGSEFEFETVGGAGFLEPPPANALDLAANEAIVAAAATPGDAPIQVAQSDVSAMMWADAATLEEEEDNFEHNYAAVPSVNIDLTEPIEASADAGPSGSTSAVEPALLGEPIVASSPGGELPFERMEEDNDYSAAVSEAPLGSSFGRSSSAAEKTAAAQPFAAEPYAGSIEVPRLEATREWGPDDDDDDVPPPPPLQTDYGHDKGGSDPSHQGLYPGDVPQLPPSATPPAAMPTPQEEFVPHHQHQAAPPEPAVQHDRSQMSSGMMQPAPAPPAAGYSPRRHPLDGDEVEARVAGARRVSENSSAALLAKASAQLSDARFHVKERAESTRQERKREPSPAALVPRPRIDLKAGEVSLGGVDLASEFEDFVRAEREASLSAARDHGRANSQENDADLNAAALDMHPATKEKLEALNMTFNPEERSWHRQQHVPPRQQPAIIDRVRQYVVADEAEGASPPSQRRIEVVRHRELASVFTPEEAKYHARLLRLREECDNKIANLRDRMSRWDAAHGFDSSSEACRYKLPKGEDGTAMEQAYKSRRQMLSCSQRESEETLGIAWELFLAQLDRGDASLSTVESLME